MSNLLETIRAAFMAPVKPFLAGFIIGCFIITDMLVVLDARRELIMFFVAATAVGVLFCVGHYMLVLNLRGG